MRRFLNKQLKHVERVKLGRVLAGYEMDSERMRITRRRVDAKKDPQILMRYEYPVGRRRAVVKPGEENAK